MFVSARLKDNLQSRQIWKGGRAKAGTDLVKSPNVAVRGLTEGVNMKQQSLRIS